jgi:hypothetical protein
VRAILVPFAVVIVASLTVAAQADVITDTDIYAITGHESQSGHGLLDLYVFNGSTTGEENQCDSFDGDDSNTEMPFGGGTWANESYVTSIGELRDFYLLCFEEPDRHEIYLSVDLNESVASFINLDALTVMIDYDMIYGDLRDNPASGDIDSDTQNLTNDNFGGGTTVAWLDSSPKLLPENEPGGGWADYAIRLGIDPFDPAFSNDTRILIHWESSDHTDGGDTIFISGSFIPEPATLTLCALVGLAICRRR